MRPSNTQIPTGHLCHLAPHHEAPLRIFLAEFEPEHETLHGYFLDAGMPYPEVCETLRLWSNGESLPEGWVPNTTWFWMADEVIKGVINLRHRLTPALEALADILGTQWRQATADKAFQQPCFALCYHTVEPWG